MSRILGIDIGSLTIKAAIYDPYGARVEKVAIVAHERQPLQRAFRLIERLLADYSISRLAVTGDFGENLARAFATCYINPHLAAAEANLRLFPHLRTILNVGASSSQLIIIKDDGKGKPRLEDILFPPHCSAGTGSFLDQSASRFGYSIEEFGRLALKSKNPETISGTCAVFAGSDMIDKQQKGALQEDISAGLHYALIRYLLGTLSRGRKLEGPYSLQGGVAENVGIVKALRDILSSSQSHAELFIPACHRFMPAIGAAILATEPMAKDSSLGRRKSWLESSREASLRINELSSVEEVEMSPLILNDRVSIRRSCCDGLPVSGEEIPTYVGVDVGSVSTSVAVLFFRHDDPDRDWRLATKRYLPTQSNPLGAVIHAFNEVRAELGDRIRVEEVAVTGSGRKLIANFLGGVLDVNEITAHRTGSQTVAERMRISVDEIFEIGGQDSKYIRGIEQFEMNKSCAAGTGSFIEEQAKQLGVRIEDFASQALQARSPVSFGNKKCTVFIEEELAARQGHRSTADLLASVAYAVAENYLNQFKIGDRAGRTIFFQGGVALNEAVVAAFQHLTKARIIVPEHNEVMGAIGAAIYARRHCRSRTSFIGLEKLQKRQHSQNSFQCEGCANLCHVAQITTDDGAAFYGGDRCEKYSLQKDQKDQPEITVPDLFQEREQMLGSTHRDSVPKSGRSAIRIGIPRLFSSYYEFFPLWKTFFGALGFEVVISGKTNKKLISKGLDHVVAETCLPAEITYGHLKDLLEKEPDHIFFPCLIDGPSTKWKERKSYLCILSQNMPFAAACTLPELQDTPGRLLRPAIHLHPRRLNFEEEMIKVAETLGKGKKEAKSALRSGLEALSGFQRRLRARGQEIFSDLDSYAFPIVVIGRSYVLEDPGINVDLPKMIREAGGFPLPLDYLPLDDVDILDNQNLSNWRYYHKVLRAAEIVRQNAKLSSIFFSVFACGPDAFLEEFYREALGGKPFLGIEVGKTTAPGHMQTRVEALMDGLREKKGALQTYRRPTFFIQAPRKKRILYVPRMDEDVPVFIESLKLLGVEARVLESSSAKSLALANRHIPEKTCLPVRMTAGDYLNFLLNSSENPRRIAFFNHQADGACRQKMYALLQALVFRRLGFDMIPVITPAPGRTVSYTAPLELINGGKRLTRIDIARFFYRFWQSIVANEAIRQLVLSRRPYEIRKGSMDRAYEVGQAEFCGTIVRGNIKKGMRAFLEQILQVQVDKSQDKVKIGIVGEGYVRTHGPSNQHAVRHLEELGAVVVLPMASSYLNYALENAKRASGKWMLKLISSIRRHVEHDLAKHVSPYLVFPEPEPGQVIDEAAGFTDPRLASEAVEGIGTASLFTSSGNIHGILSLIPAHCMAGSALQCFLEKLHNDTGIPVLTVSLDGIYDKGFKTGLGVLVRKAGLYRASLA